MITGPADQVLTRIFWWYRFADCSIQLVGITEASFFPQMASYQESFLAGLLSKVCVAARGTLSCYRMFNTPKSSGCANNEWMYHRSCRITSTVTKPVTTAMENERAGKEVRRRNLALRLLKSANLSHKPAIRRGKDLENVATDYFVSRMNLQGFQVSSYLVGFVIHPAENWIGASPDRYVHITRDIPPEDHWSLIQIKTFDAEKTLEQVEFLYPVLCGDHKIYKLKKNHSHYYQMQTAMFCTGIWKAFLVTYGSSETQNNIEEIVYDKQCVDRILKKSSEFYFGVMLQEICIFRSLPSQRLILQLCTVIS